MKHGTIRTQLRTLCGDNVEGLPSVRNKYTGATAPDQIRLFRLAEVHTCVKKMMDLLIKFDMLRISDGQTGEVNKYLYWYGLYWYEEVNLRGKFHCTSSMETHKARFFSRSRN